VDRTAAPTPISGIVAGLGQRAYTDPREMAPSASQVPLVIGRYALYGAIASGGMATVHFGRLLGPVGFTRTVAVKRLHAHLAKDPDFVSMFLDEARLAARVRHPNVVPTLDVVSENGELFLVMEYVQGESLSRLVRAARDDGVELPLPVLAAIVVGMLHGLHAAHEATNERGEPLDLVHRDVSPQNVLVGVDGVARVLDFGVAKAVGRLHTTRDGSVKGKPAYMAPEQLFRGTVDRRADIYAAGVVLWELLTGERLFTGDSESAIIASVMEGAVEPPSKRRAGLSDVLDDVTMRALSRDPSARFGTARQMARELEERVAIASPAVVGEWVEQLASDALGDRSRLVSSIETNEVDPEPTTVVQTPPPQTVVATEARPRRRWLWAAFAAGLLFAAAAALGIRSRDRAPSSPPPPAAPSAEAPPPAAVSSSVAVTIVSAPPSVATTTSAPSKKTVHSHPPPPRPSSTNCVVKSYVDSLGVKHYFNECPKK